MDTKHRTIPAILMLLATIHAGIGRGETAERTALLIGNDQYIVSPLESCVNDARAVSAWLQSIGYTPSEVKLLTDASSEEMEKGLRELLANCQKTRRKQVVIYYSGHGMYLPDDDGDEGASDDKDEAFVGCYAKRPTTAAEFEKVILRDDEFYKYVAQIRGHCEQLVVILDCCYSGGATKGVADLAGPSKALTVKMIMDGATDKPQAKSPKTEAPQTAARNVVRESDIHTLADTNSGGTQQRGLAPLLLLTASNQYQTSAAGVPPRHTLSMYTKALMDLMQKTKPGQAISFTDAQERLKDTLQKIPQHPQVIAIGLDADQNLVPDVFPAPKSPIANREFADRLYDLFTLTKPADDWKLEVSSNVTPPLQEGTKFGLNVKSNVAGYIVIVTAAASGEVAFLYPNQYQPDNSIGANRGAVLPNKEAFRVRKPLGEEKYFVFLLEKNPFRGFPFGAQQGPLVVGNVGALLAWYPELTPVLKANIQRNLEKAIRVRPKPGRAQLRGIGRVLTLNTIPKNP